MDVSDVNEYPPRFPADSVRASVAEEEAVGSEVKCGIKKVKSSKLWGQLIRNKFGCRRWCS